MSVGVGAGPPAAVDEMGGPIRDRRRTVRSGWASGWFSLRDAGGAGVGVASPPGASVVLVSGAPSPIGRRPDGVDVRWTVVSPL
ncbi:hypothetical protein GCM10010464_01810 [Pseudonocardia yunnanensis]|uniref:Uncharacterized protein n=1 Tax=Pseudonocardia yunnanensis TaxID=58107 RepID=A0ABW4F0D7_9PSEU